MLLPKQHSLIVLAILGTLTFISCKKDSGAGNTNSNCANNTVWLKNGHQWVYVNTPIYIFADTVFVSLEEINTGEFKTTSKYDDGTFYPTITVYTQPCNNSIYQAPTADLVNKQEVYRIDGNVGDSWTFTSTTTTGATATTKTTIIAKNVSKTVPAGTFLCTGFRQVSTISTGESVTVESYINNEAGTVYVDGSTAHYELARKNY